MAAEAALAQSVNAALLTAAASQGGLAPLLADLVQAQQTQDLPAPVQAAILEVLALRSPLEAEITGPDIKTALNNSGLFSEAKAAVGLQATTAGAQDPPAGTDIKAALLVLRQVLTTWLSDTATQPQAPTAAKDAPPAPSRPPADNPSPQTYRGAATSIAPLPASAAPVSAALSPAMSPEGPAKAAPSTFVPPQTQIPSSSGAPADASQNLTAAERAPIIPQPATTSTGPQIAPPTSNGKAAPPILQQPVKASPATLPPGPDEAAKLAVPERKAAPPILQQAVKASPATVPAGPDEAAKLAVPEPSRTPLNNAPPLIFRGPANAQPSLAPMSPVPVPTFSTPAFSAQGAPTAPETGTSQPQAQIAAAPEAMNEVPQQAATSETVAYVEPSAPTIAGLLPAGTDLTLALVLLQQVLKTSLNSVPAQPYAPETGKNSGQEPRQTAANNPPPPYRGGPTSAQPALQSTLPADANPRLVGLVLLSHTEAALAHLKLLQIASLPESPQGNPRHEDMGSRWMFEIPFSTPQGSTIAQFEIRRDGSGTTAEQSGPVWRARFSLDVEPMGPVHAQIVLMGERAWVTLWAEREASVDILRKNEALLSQALKDSDVVPEVAFCLGAPHRRVARAGQFLDRAS